MARKSIWIGIGVFILALLVSVDPSDRSVALSDISIGGSQALAKKGPSHGPYTKGGPDLPSIFDTIDDLELDSDDDGGPDDDTDAGPEDQDDDGQGDD